MPEYLKKIYHIILATILFVPLHIVYAGKALDWLKQTGVNGGYSIEGGSGGEGKPTVGLEAALGSFATFVAVLLGVLFLILILYAGWIWGTSRGNEEKVEQAKKMIIWSTAGITIIIIARIIVEFILMSLGEATSSYP